MKTKYKIALLILSLVVLVAASPVLQQATRFRSIIVSDFIDVAGPLTVGGAADFNSTVNFADATVSGLGEYFATDDSGNVTITGTLSVSDTSTFTGAITALDALTVTGATALNGGLTMDTNAFSVANTSGNTVVSGTLAVSDTATITGNTTLGGTLSLEGVTFSGPVKFGSLTVTDGVTVTHGLGTTPTSVIVIPSWISTTVTQTLFITNVGSSTFAVKITDGAVTTTTAYWMAGR